MGSIIYFLYRYIVSNLFTGLVYLISPFNKKLKLRLEEEKNIKNNPELTLKPKGKNRRILFHCSSLGEWEQAVPVIEIIKKNNPGIQIIVSFFSISGYRHVKNNPYIDGKIFLPFDTYKHAKRFLNDVLPDLWVISAYDVWPNHVMAAKKLQIPIIIITATLSETSGRHKGLAKHLNKYIFKNIHAIYTRSANDSKRFLNIYPFPEKLLSYGDTRADRVYENSHAIRKMKTPMVFMDKKADDVVFIAGSTWPADEKIVLPGTIALLKKHPNLKAIIVPHEIGEAHIQEIEKTFSESALETERFSSFNQKNGTNCRVAIIDAIGVLAQLYKDCNIAYIGGSFGKGVHNVLEPAVFGLPVLFGPRHRNSQEAISLTEIGATFPIKTIPGFIDTLEPLVTDNDFRKECSEKAFGYVRNSLGASGKIYQHLTRRFEFIR